MKDAEVLAAMIATTADHLGTSFSETCLTLLTKIIEASAQKKLEKNKDWKTKLEGWNPNWNFEIKLARTTRRNSLLVLASFFRRTPGKGLLKK